MPSFRTGTVTEIISERAGLQRARVHLEGDAAASRAVNYRELIGDVGVGDEVVCNTTAIELGLGTGGWHVVHWNLSKRGFSNASGGHIMKVRYTSLQTDVMSAEEQDSPHHDALRDVRSLEGMPVMLAGLHSLLAACAAGFRTRVPDAHLGYVMTDGAALPMALSDLVVELREAGFVDSTATTGQAFGGEYECVNAATALLALRHVAGADAAVCAMGPGVVGTGTRYGFSAIEVAHLCAIVSELGGHPVVVVRASGADSRDRHRGVSHHTLRTLELVAPGTDVVIAGGTESDRLRADLSHLDINVRCVDADRALDILGEHGLAPTSMGRGIEDDPVFWQCGAAAGVYAASLLAQIQAAE